MIEEICWNCEWWNKQDWFEECGKENACGRVASCLRHAPIAVEKKSKHGGTWTIWPQTNGEERCGDFKKEVKI